MTVKLEDFHIWYISCPKLAYSRGGMTLKEAIEEAKRVKKTYSYVKLKDIILDYNWA